MKGENNDVSLDMDKNKLIKPKAPTLKSIEEIFKSYPTAERRGWTKDFITSLVDYDVIGGLYSESNPKTLMIIEESFVAFLAYHDQYYETRANLVKENLDVAKHNRKIKEKARKSE